MNIIPQSGLKPQDRDGRKTSRLHTEERFLRRIRVHQGRPRGMQF